MRLMLRPGDLQPNPLVSPRLYPTLSLLASQHQHLSRHRVQAVRSPKKTSHVMVFFPFWLRLCAAGLAHSAHRELGPGPGRADPSVHWVFTRHIP